LTCDLTVGGLATALTQMRIRILMRIRNSLDTGIIGHLDLSKRPKEDTGHKLIFIIKNEWPIITEASLEIIVKERPKISLSGYLKDYWRPIKLKRLKMSSSRC
jgi:hypothetical protein